MSRLRGEVNRILKQIAAHGDRKSKAELYNLTANHLLTVARRYVKNKADADDAVMNAFIKAFRHAGSFDSRKDGYNWLCKIVEREALELNGREDVFVSDLPNVAEEPTFIEQAEINDEAERYLNSLKPEAREIIYLRFWEDLTVREIAARLGKTKSAVHKAIVKALKDLKEQTKKGGLS